MNQPEAAELTRRLQEFCRLGPRWCGTLEEHRARQYIERQFNRTGLDFRTEPFEYLSYQPKSYSLRLLKPTETEIRCRPLTYGANTPKNGTIADLVYVGEGKELDYKTLKDSNLSPRGKTVLVEAMRSYLAHPLAESNGAAGFVLATSTPGGKIRLGTAVMGMKAAIPSISISYEDSHFLRSIVASAQAQMEIKVNASFEKTTSNNVVAKIPGKSSVERKIVVVAHYDSYWVGPHALDNASGVIALLALARMLAKSSLDLSVELIAVSGEELGLLGSRSYVKNHMYDIREIVACISLDTLFGAGNSSEPEIHVSPTLAGLVHSTLEDLGLNCSKWYTLPSPMQSDHVPFFEKGIPSMYLTSSLPPYYHTEDDKPNVISIRKLKNGIALAAKIITRLSELHAK